MCPPSTSEKLQSWFEFATRVDFVTSEITTEREREVLMVDRQREGGGKPGRERANAKGGGRGGARGDLLVWGM